jgi:4-alpha-glucanotransferase
MGITLLQTLPLNRVDGFDCPYSSPSAFGCEPRLLSLEWFVERNLLAEADLAQTKSNGLRRAFENFKNGKGAASLRAKYSEFRDRHDDWLVPLAKFLGDDSLDFQPFLEFCFREQWSAFRSRAEELGIRLIGDIPIFVSAEGVDILTIPEQFKLDEKGHPLVVAGVPPDLFSEMGQNWGAPVYDWEKMKADDWRWWRKRLRLQFELFHTVRLDHFRGFAATWEIAVVHGDARKGEWVQGGGASLLAALVEESPGNDSLLAEDLGVITPDVDSLRDGFKLPTMRVQQFHWEQQFPKHSVAYTGTHDNDTLWGWHQSLDHEAKRKLHSHLGLSDGRTEREKFIPRMIEDLLRRDSDWCIVPVQDLLLLGPEARMNRPGTVGGNNWKWRLSPNQLETADLSWFSDLIRASGR